MPPPDDLPPALHEHSDVTSRFGFVWFGGLVLSIGVVTGLAMLLFPGSLRDRSISLPFPNYPNPNLQSSPRADMAQFYGQEMQYLHSTGWVDQEKGIVHIPIEDAMRKVAQQGIAGWPISGEARK